MPAAASGRGRENAYGILLAGVLPLLGVLLLGWEPLAVMVVLWLEGLAIGLFLALRIYWRPPWAFAAMLTRLYPMLLILLAWFSFAGSQLMGIMVISSIAANGAEEEDWAELWAQLVELTLEQRLWLPAVLLLLDQGFRFWREWLQAQRWLKVSIWPLLGSLFGRVVLVQLVFLIALAVVLFLGAPQAMLLFLLLAKTGLELVLWRMRLKSK